MHITVDLASRFSAYAVVEAGGGVLSQGDSFNKSAVEFVRELTRIVQEYPDSLLVVEDVPYGLSRQVMIKPVLRLQGILIGAMADIDATDRLFFLNPSTWQRYFEGVFKGGAQGAASAALKLGYEPPNLLEDYAHLIPENGPARSKVRASLRKSTTDYVDAYLMGRWANENLFGPYTPDNYEKLLGVSGLQPAMI